MERRGMTTTVILKNGFRFQGKVIEETDSSLVLDEIKLGHTVIDKASIAVRSEMGGKNGRGKS